MALPAAVTHLGEQAHTNMGRIFREYCLSCVCVRRWRARRWQWWRPALWLRSCSAQTPMER